MATADIAEELDISILKVETLNSYQFLAVGAACAIAAICSRIFGKRPVYLISAVIEFAAAIWNATGTSYSSLLGSRILYGLGVGAFESLVLATIGDLYYVGFTYSLSSINCQAYAVLTCLQVHERGRGVAFYSFVALGCSQLSPILGGYITDHQGWRIQLWILVAFWVAAILLLFFYGPETTFVRPLENETDLAISSDAESSASDVHQASDPVQIGKSEAMSQIIESLPRSRRQNHSHPLKAIVRFFITGLYPITWFSFVVSLYIHS